MRLVRFVASGVHGYLKFNIKFNESLTFITGINGSGKTSAVNAIVALLTPDLSVLANLIFDAIKLEIENDGSKLSLSAPGRGFAAVAAIRAV